MSVLVIIQARMNSSRLPGKSMALIAGKPLVEHVIARAKATVLPMDVIVATTDTAADDVLTAHVESLSVPCYRGSETDVLARFYWAAERYTEAEAIVRLTADDPFKDPELIDTVVGLFLQEWAKPAADVAPPQIMAIGGPTWPTGLDVEVFTRLALTRAFQEAKDPKDREHVTTWMWRELHPWILRNPTGHGSANLRWTIDEPADLDFARSVYDKLYPLDPTFGYRQMRLAGY